MGQGAVKRNLDGPLFLHYFYIFFKPSLAILIGHLCQPSYETVTALFHFARLFLVYSNNYFEFICAIYLTKPV